VYHLFRGRPFDQIRDRVEYNEMMRKTNSDVVCEEGTPVLVVEPMFQQLLKFHQKNINIFLKRN
jgi:hypothetical protein